MAAAAERVFKFLEETEEDQKAEHHAVITEINDEGKTIILVTHDAKVAGMAKKQLFIQDGKGYYEN